MSFSVILPTLNEKGHIIELIDEISNIFKIRNTSFEIIIVDDSSIDGTQDVVENYALKKNFLKLIKRNLKKRNLAKSIQAGIDKAKFEFVIWMDADFQHPPKYIDNFIKETTNNDVIISSRFLLESERYFNSDKLKKEINENQSFFFNKLCRFLLFNDLTDYTSGFICIKKIFLNNFVLDGFYGDYFVKLLVYLKTNNFKIKEIPFKDELRASGQSKTLVNLNLKYLYTCLRYFLTLINCILIKFKK
ncbi:glycosyltransferase [Candidatus Pelagibacter bacterium]|nr:glycosyltransferase [Candidatus Pelagibacter bacterium]MDC3157331.1 glycosyltransferase [Candidatus Pelagibacter bacterium]